MLCSVYMLCMRRMSRYLVELGLRVAPAENLQGAWGSPYPQTKCDPPRTAKERVLLSLIVSLSVIQVFSIRRSRCVVSLVVGVALAANAQGVLGTPTPHTAATHLGLPKNVCF